jgi:hypothetical protein
MVSWNSGVKSLCKMNCFAVGGHVNVIEETENLLQRLEEIVPNESLCKTPPLEPWFASADVEVDAEPDLSELAGRGGAFGATAESIQTVSDLLSVECKRLLYKADSAISKATKG